jgi:hypothetical protein
VFKPVREFLTRDERDGGRRTKSENFRSPAARLIIESTAQL